MTTAEINKMMDEEKKIHKNFKRYLKWRMVFCKETNAYEEMVSLQERIDSLQAQHENMISQLEKAKALRRSWRREKETRELKLLVLELLKRFGQSTSQQLSTPASSEISPSSSTTEPPTFAPETFSAADSLSPPRRRRRRTKKPQKPRKKLPVDSRKTKSLSAYRSSPRIRALILGAINRLRRTSPVIQKPSKSSKSSNIVSSDPVVVVWQSGKPRLRVVIHEVKMTRILQGLQPSTNRRPRHRPRLTLFLPPGQKDDENDFRVIDSSVQYHS